MGILLGAEILLDEALKSRNINKIREICNRIGELLPGLHEVYAHNHPERHRYFTDLMFNLGVIMGSASKGDYKTAIAHFKKFIAYEQEISKIILNKA